jgi:MFS family permease
VRGWTEQEQARGRRLIVVMNCFSCIPSHVFLNSVLLLFLTSLAMERVGTMMCLSLPALAAAVFQVQFAHGADRWGKKRFGAAGIALYGVAFAGFIAAAVVPPAAGRILAPLFIAVFAVGACLHISGWFALILPMIPTPIRAAYFGHMRLIYQSVVVAAGLVCSLLLEWNSTPAVFAGLFAWFLAVVCVWRLLYARLPEMEPPNPGLPGLREAIGHVFRNATYLPFCAYAFLLALFTGGCPILFGMIEKTYLNLSNGTVVLLANVRMLGAIAGFFLGGKVVERFGTKTIFLNCHFAFGLVLLLFLWRNGGAGPVVPILAAAEALFGLLAAASSVAFTVEMYALIPAENKSLSTSVFMTLQGAGTTLGGMLSAGVIHLGVLKEEWSLDGIPRSDYDALLLICATLVIVAAVTLGLVPSVTGRAQGPSIG